MELSILQEGSNLFTWFRTLHDYFGEKTVLSSRLEPERDRFEPSISTSKNKSSAFKYIRTLIKYVRIFYEYL